MRINSETQEIAEYDVDWIREEVAYNEQNRVYQPFKSCEDLLDLRLSRSTQHEIALLFGSIKTHEEKEEAAKRAIPLVRACKTEEEAIAAVARVIEEMTE